MEHHVAKAGGLMVSEPLAARIPVAHRNAFFANVLAHLAAYGVGLLRGLVVCIWALIRCWRMARQRQTDNPFGDDVAEVGME